MNKIKIKAKLSNGNETEIKILPDQVAEIIKKALSINNLTDANTSIKLEETRHKNIPRVVYNIQTNKHGKFLGVFKLAMKVESQVDPETGEIIQISKPWWAFLVREYIDSQNPPAPGNETNNNQTNGNNTIGNETIPGNETIGNNTIVNETITNQTETNNTITNQTEVNVTNSTI